MTDGTGAGSAGRIAWVARSGYGARGVVYLIVGGLAVLAAFGGGGETTDSKGALRTIIQQPFGQVLLGLVALGLVGFAIWRLVQAIADPGDNGSDAKALAKRASFVVSAIVNALLAFFALSLIFGWGTGGGGGGGAKEDWTAWLLQQPFGRWLVALVGLVVIGVGVAHMIKGYKAKFEEHLAMDPATLDKVSPVCRFGLIARGVVFLIIGGFLLVAAWRFSSGQVVGLAGALRTLEQQPYGWILLGIVALGLFAFGVFGLVQARYRRIDSPA